MNQLVIYLLVVLGPALMCGLGLLVHRQLKHRRAVRQAAWQRSHKLSVAELAARIEQEQAGRELHWPRADPDRGVIRDDRPTELLPEVSDEPRRVLRPRPYVRPPQHDPADNPPNRDE